MELSLEAQNLKLDKANECIVSRYHNGAPRFVMRRAGDPPLHTRGQASESAVKELETAEFCEKVGRLILAARC